MMHMHAQDAKLKLNYNLNLNHNLNLRCMFCITAVENFFVAGAKKVGKPS